MVEIIIEAEFTNSQFDAAASHTRLKEWTREAARLVLVHGYSYAQAGRFVRPNMTRQAVHRACKRIRDVGYSV